MKKQKQDRCDENWVGGRLQVVHIESFVSKEKFEF